MASKKTRLNKKTLWVLGGILGVESVACLGLGFGIHTRKAALEKTLAGKETALADIRTVSASLPALQDQYLRMQAQVQYLEGALPPAEYIPTLLGQVEQTARACGVQIQEFRPKASPLRVGPETEDQKDAAADTTTKTQFEMVIRGNYKQVQQFLQSLTRFRKILSLDTLNLRPSGNSKAGVSPDLTANLVLTAYVLAPTQMAPAGKPATATATASAADAAGSAAAEAASAAGSAARQAAADRGITQRSGEAPADTADPT